MMFTCSEGRTSIISYALIQIFEPFSYLLFLSTWSRLGIFEVMISATVLFFIFGLILLAGVMMNNMKLILASVVFTIIRILFEIGLFVYVAIYTSKRGKDCEPDDGWYDFCQWEMVILIGFLVSHGILILLDIVFVIIIYRFYREFKSSGNILP